ncbi:hypothetical protein PVAP13_3NG209813 [Panicum virgatum]|uniref:Uncharacterized protein n=1 Tax=Panicum virgatum TaxID=38727 RepID=A0A8T0UIF9_PANVG|nr:hypothetical protein PVAP13_3NG209813 [Panicum virgatum]
MFVTLALEEPSRQSTSSWRRCSPTPTVAQVLTTVVERPRERQRTSRAIFFLHGGMGNQSDILYLGVTGGTACRARGGSDPPCSTASSGPRRSAAPPPLARCCHSASPAPGSRRGALAQSPREAARSHPAPGHPCRRPPPGRWRGHGGAERGRRELLPPPARLLLQCGRRSLAAPSFAPRTSPPCGSRRHPHGRGGRRPRRCLEAAAAAGAPILQRHLPPRARGGAETGARRGGDGRAAGRRRARGGAETGARSRPAGHAGRLVLPNRSVRFATTSTRRREAVARREGRWPMGQLEGGTAVRGAREGRCRGGACICACGGREAERGRRRSDAARGGAMHAARGRVTSG